MTERITVLGATGSIGRATLDVIERHPDKVEVFALGAKKNWQIMRELCERYRPRYAALEDGEAAQKLKSSLRGATEVLSGEAALVELARANEVSAVMAAISGADGARHVLAAAVAGKKILLANKEVLVMAGSLVMQAVEENGAQLLPVDSEHNAIFQCLLGEKEATKVVLTASGGPFLFRDKETLENVTALEATQHPTWLMGSKISVDSATLMNKGLEAIEARYLFKLPVAAIGVIVHPQSIVHALVYLKDNSVLAQMAEPDMRVAIANTLFYPERRESGAKPLDLNAHSPLEFYPPDLEKFRCLKLALEALKTGENAMIALNAANEVAVAAFLNNTIHYLDIANIVERTLEATSCASTPSSFEVVLSQDLTARNVAKSIINRL